MEATSQMKKYLTFRLANEGYAIEVLKVREIIGMINITPVPQTPNFVKGVINLRGKVIAVIDLRMKFGLEQMANTRETCMIIVDLKNKEIGIIVDAVREVRDISASDVDETPSFGVRVNTDYIKGIGKIAAESKDADSHDAKQEVVIILDIDKVLSNEELMSVGA